MKALDSAKKLGETTNRRSKKDSDKKNTPFLLFSK